MTAKIITPNEKVNEHIETVREVMTGHGCHPDLILMSCKLIEVAYGYGVKDGLEKILGNNS